MAFQKKDLQETMSSLKPYPRVYYKASKFASRIANDMARCSRFVDSAKEEAVPKFDRDEVVLGNLLGSGGFSNVFEAQEINVVQQTLNSFAKDQDKKISFAKCASGGRYAVKMLKRELHEEDYCNGAADLMIETKILASLEPHNNIIQLHGVSAAGAAGFAQGIEGGYFLIVDRLKDILTKRMQTWSETNTPLTDRVLVALELTSALKHLHKFNIVFRDLKPDNIGFDAHGTLKLFDFGLAKELNPRDHVEVNTYEMSGQTGCRRYMAPEVALGDPYGLGADVYGFAVIFWQICSLTEPFSGMSTVDHFDAVVMNQGRPPVNPEWPKKICNIMKWSWAANQQMRPKMKAINRALKCFVKDEIKSKMMPKTSYIKITSKTNDKKLMSLPSLKEFESHTDTALPARIGRTEAQGSKFPAIQHRRERNLEDALTEAIKITARE